MHLLACIFSAVGCTCSPPAWAQWPIHLDTTLPLTSASYREVVGYPNHPEFSSDPAGSRPLGSFWQQIVERRRHGSVIGSQYAESRIYMDYTFPTSDCLPIIAGGRLLKGTECQQHRSKGYSRA